MVGSREEVVAGGQRVRARKYPWGMVEGKGVLSSTSVWCDVFVVLLCVVENETHCDFVKLREMIIRYKMSLHARVCADTHTHARIHMWAYTQIIANIHLMFIRSIIFGKF